MSNSSKPPWLTRFSPSPAEGPRLLLKLRHGLPPALVPTALPSHSLLAPRHGSPLSCPHQLPGPSPSLTSLHNPLPPRMFPQSLFLSLWALTFSQCKFRAHTHSQPSLAADFLFLNLSAPQNLWFTPKSTLVVICVCPELWKFRLCS